MTRNQRIALVVAALAVAIVAFLIAQPGDDDGEQSATTTPAPAETESQENEGAPTETESEAPEEEAPEREATAEEPAPAPEPEAARIRIQNGVVSGTTGIQVTTGETVHIVVTTDAPDELHLHGYDITRKAAPGRPARFRFKADLEGVFELESHEAEHEGRDPSVARVAVTPQ